jgi:hypothetical protein
MKFAKGLLTDELPKPPDVPKVDPAPSPVPEPTPKPTTSPVEVEKNRLFQTVEETKGSSRKYLGVLGVVAVLVAIGGAVAWYLNRPGAGDKIRLSSAVELSVRDHFLMKEKRTATDISFYQCEGFIWARVGVETRTDLPNPLFRVPTYKARITQSGDSTSITAAPIMSPAEDQPCN